MTGGVGDVSGIGVGGVGSTTGGGTTIGEGGAIGSLSVGPGVGDAIGAAGGTKGSRATGGEIFDAIGADSRVTVGVTRPRSRGGATSAGALPGVASDRGVAMLGSAVTGAGDGGADSVMTAPLPAAGGEASIVVEGSVAGATTGAFAITGGESPPSIPYCQPTMPATANAPMANAGQIFIRPPGRDQSDDW